MCSSVRRRFQSGTDKTHNPRPGIVLPRRNNRQANRCAGRPANQCHRFRQLFALNRDSRARFLGNCDDSIAHVNVVLRRSRRVRHETSDDDVPALCAQCDTDAHDRLPGRLDICPIRVRLHRIRSAIGGFVLPARNDALKKRVIRIGAHVKRASRDSDRAKTGARQDTGQ